MIHIVDPPPVSTQTQEGLRREVGVWGLGSNLINTVVGAGIFVLPAVVAKGLGSAGIIAYIFCGILITMVMLCFAEVGSKITLSGGAYNYIGIAFGKYFGFLTTNIFIFGCSLLANAAVANALADTLSYPLPLFNNAVFRGFFFVAVYSLLSIPNIRGVSKGVALIKITTLAKLTPLLTLLVLGATHVSIDNLTWETAPSFHDIGETSLILFFAFQGAENSLGISGEVRTPKKTIPKGILISILIVVLLYAGIQLVSQGILGDSLPLFGNAPLAEVANQIMGPFGVTLMIVGAAISMFGYLSGDILNMPRVIFGAARDRVIPIPALARIHPRFATPYMSIILFAALGCAYAISGGFTQLAILSSASSLLIYLGVALAVIKLRLTKARDPKTFRIPGGYTIPILAVIAIGWFLSNLSMNEKIGMAIFIGILSVLFLAVNWLKKKGRDGEHAVEQEINRP
ncbi:MAG: amino acid permease [Cyclobacteriaceae bacterium]